MFEKEAEEILNNHCDCELLPECMAGIRRRCSDFEESKELLIEGIEFGYNKANEWHYVKDGDLPKDCKEYLVYKINGYGCKSIQVMQFNNKHCWCANCQKEIIAWKEIVLPELKESE